jgi:hypothetical protein
LLRLLLLRVLTACAGVASRHDTFLPNDAETPFYI